MSTQPHRPRLSEVVKYACAGAVMAFILSAQVGGMRNEDVALFTFFGAVIGALTSITLTLLDQYPRP